MISMSKVHSIREMRMRGLSISQISRELDISRNTVYKYLKEQDLSPAMPVSKQRERKLDPYRQVIEGWLDEDRRSWHKQRHTAHRIWQRLREEIGVEVGESTVRHYVHDLRKERGDDREQFLDLVWAPGEAQADFGEADFYVSGIRKRLSYFVLDFPFSNVGLAQVFPGENAECVCQGLKNIFEFVGGVPLRIVFDNATGIGRRVSDNVRLSKTFSAFAAHYAFAFSFCNPNSGHEKGAVESKVGYIRRNLFVPVCRIDNNDSFNRRLLEKCMTLSDKDHYVRQESENSLFIEDKFAMSGLPSIPFDVVKYERHRADKYGKVCIDGKHLYSSDPVYAGQELICALRALTVTIADTLGNVVCEHKRAYGSAPTDTTDPASQLALLAKRPGGWQNSRVREAMSDDLKSYMDDLEQEGLKENLRTLRNVSAASGWSAALSAAEIAFASTGRIDKASVTVGAEGLRSLPIGYDDPIDLSIYDQVLAEA